MSEYDGKQFVGIDLHRHRSVIVRQDADGNQLSITRISNDPVALAQEIGKAGECPEVVLEATNGWYWAADVLAEAGARVHLAHPLGIKGMSQRRVKTDARDATDLADLLRMRRLPEAWIAPPQLREVRELVRHRVKLVNQRSGLKAGVRGAGQQGLSVPVSDLFGVGGQTWLATAPLDAAYRARVNSLCRLISEYGFEIDLAGRLVTTRLARDPVYGPGYRVIQQIPGIGPTLAAVLVVEIGDVHRFTGARQLCSWAGLTPRHRESDTRVHRGAITKQGSRLVRWAAVEAAQKVPGSCAWLAGAPGWGHAAAGPQHRHRRGGPQTAHSGVLRPAGRAHQRPDSSGPAGGGVSGSVVTRHVIVVCLIRLPAVWVLVVAGQRGRDRCLD